MIKITSDLHLWNTNIIEYCQRPFENATEMTTRLIDIQNESLDSDDILYDLGDYSLKSTDNMKLYFKLKKMQKQIKQRHLILGNHDSLDPFTYVNIGLFHSVHTAFWFEYKGYKILMVHDPCVFQPGLNFNIGLCGHIHKLFTEQVISKDRIVINVGVDVRDFEPISIDKIIEIAENKWKEFKE